MHIRLTIQETARKEGHIQSATPFEVRADQVRGVTVVKMKGSIDASNLKRLGSQIEPYCAPPNARVVLDCSDLGYVNSTSFEMMIHFHRLCQCHHGQFALAGVRKNVRRIMEILNLDKILTVFESTDEAIQRLQCGAAADQP